MNCLQHQRLFFTSTESHLQEPGMQRSLCDVKHLRAVNTAIVIHLLDDETIGEGRDVQHVEQCGLAGTNLVTKPDQTDITLGKEKLVSYWCRNVDNLFSLTPMLFINEPGTFQVPQFITSPRFQWFPWRSLWWYPEPGRKRSSQDPDQCSGQAQSHHKGRWLQHGQLQVPVVKKFKKMLLEINSKTGLNMGLGHNVTWFCLKPYIPGSQGMLTWQV